MALRSVTALFALPEGEKTGETVWLGYYDINVFV